MRHYVCFSCGEQILSNNQSKEHIIPNSIGGKKKIQNFICRKCNEKFGQTWDAILAKQFNPLALYLGIKRERGESPAEIFSTTKGEQYKMTSGSNLEIPCPVIKEQKIDDNKVQLEISARSHEEAKKIIADLERKKYPGLSRSVDIDSLEYSEMYIEDPLHIPLAVGGKQVGKSIVKSCLALAYDAGLSGLDYSNVKKYFSDEIQPGDIWTYCYQDYVRNRDEFNVIHCVHIKASSKNKNIIGYIEYFSVFKFIVLLSNNYVGNDISATYGIDPLNGCKVDIDVCIDLSNHDVIKLFNAPYDFEEVKHSLGKVIAFRQKRSIKREQKRVLNEAVRYAFTKTGLSEGEMIGPEHISILVNAIMEKLKPFLIHNSCRNLEIEHIRRKQQLGEMKKQAKSHDNEDIT